MGQNRMMVAAHPNEQKSGCLRLLVVEDNYLVAANLKMMLEHIGHRVIGPVPSVREGLVLVENESFDGAILDVNLSDGSCVPIARALKARQRPFVLVTGYASPELSDAMLEENRRLLKPIDLDTLEEVVREALTPI